MLACVLYGGKSSRFALRNSPNKRGIVDICCNSSNATELRCALIQRKNFTILPTGSPCVVWVASGLGPLVWCGWQVAWVPLCGVGVAWVPLCGVGGKWPGSPCVVWVWPGSPCVVWVASGLGTAVSEVNWMPPCLLLRLSVQEVV